MKTTFIRKTITYLNFLNVLVEIITVYSEFFSCNKRQKHNNKNKNKSNVCHFTEKTVSVCNY